MAENQGGSGQQPKLPSGASGGGGQQQGAFTIELATPRNNNISFPPLRQTLRGRWSRSVLVGVTTNRTPALQNMPDIPGMCITLDPARRQARVYDPLGLPENKLLCDEINGYYRQITGTLGRPESEKTVTDLKEGGVKTWAYWMCRLLESDHARLVAGTPPTVEQVSRWPGKTQIEFFRQSAGSIRGHFLEDQDAERERIERAGAV